MPTFVGEIIYTTMTPLEIILTAVSSILGGCNIFQLVNLRSEKRKHSAEADQAQINSLNKIIDTYDQQFATLQGRYDKLQDKYDTLVEKYDTLQSQYMELRDLIGKVK